MSKNKKNFISLTDKGVKFSLGGPHIGIGRESYMSSEEVSDILSKITFPTDIKQSVGTISNDISLGDGRLRIDFTK